MRGTVLACLALSVLAASGQDTIQRTTNYYRVTGSTLRELHDSFRQARPWKNHATLDALTDWRTTWRFSLSPSSEACRVASFSTTTTISITLPSWSGSTNATAELTNAWRRYFTALSQHEQAHAQNAVAAVAELRQRIAAISTAADCATLQRKLNEMARSTVAEFRKRDEEYDRETRHGATEGAFLTGRMRHER